MELIYSIWIGNIIEMKFIKAFEFLTIFSNKKTFDGLLGNPTANRYGLHVFRIILSDIIQFIKRMPFYILAPKAARHFNKQGLLVIENFLDEQSAGLVREEIERHLAQLPPAAAPNATSAVFNGMLPRPTGYDRYDGDTLNRLDFILQDSNIKNVFKSWRMHRLSLALFGMINTPIRYFIYELRHGNEKKRPDSQKLTHRDTFHHTYKLWYFTHDVELATGPFEYSVGSHRLSWKRLRWEYWRSVKISADKKLHRGGAFRVTNEELAEMGVASPKPLCVKANTLVIANTRGFHRRGFAQQGITRVGVYGSFRPIAFFPFLQP